MHELTLRSQSNKFVAKSSLLEEENKSELKELNTLSELNLFALKICGHLVFSYDFEKGMVFLLMR